MNLKKLFLMLTVFVLLGTTSFAQVYVSATNGDDTFGTGAQATPYRSIQKAINSAATGSTIYVEAGIYNSTEIPTEGAPITLAAARSFTFIGTAVGVNTTVTITDGFTLNHASAIVDFTTTGTATFNLGTSATALVLTAGTMNIATASVALGSGATITFTGGTLSAVPTTGTNLNVVFNGTTAVSSTNAFLPASLGSGTLTINQATGTVTVDNATLSAGNIVHSGAANANLTGSVTVAANGDITNSSTGTLTIGNDAASTLTLTSTAGPGSQVIVNSGGSAVINSNITYNIKNAGTSSSVADGAVISAGNVFQLTGASNLTVNGNVTFNNTNVPGVSGVNDVAHDATISNGGTGALSILGTIDTPVSGSSFATSNSVYVSVILSNTSTGSFAAATAATRGAAGTNGVINTGNGSMVLAQGGGTFTSSYDVSNTGTSSIEFKGNATIGGSVANAGVIKLNANTLTLSRSVAAVLNNTGNIYSATSAAVGSGWIKFTGDAPTMTGTGNVPNIEIASKTTFSSAGNIIYGDLKTSGAGAVTITASSDVKGNLDVNGTGTITVDDAGNAASIVRGNVNMTSGNITLGTAGLTVVGTFTMPQGTFTFGSRTLTLQGNFVRTGGTINAAAAGTGTLAFAGATNQSFTPGTQMNVYNVTVNNSGPYLANVIANDVVTIDGSLIVLNDFTITTGHVDLGTSNIRMQQTAGSSRFTNGGRGYTASGIGGIIFEGTGANLAGGGDGAVITGAQPFSNIYVRLGTQTNNVYALGAVKISGVVTLDGGGIVWNAADDVDLFSSSTLTLDDALVVPTVVINTQNAHPSPYLVDGADGGAVALAITSVYNLSYTGQTSKTIGATDFVTTKVNNLSLVAGSAGKTITFIAGAGTIVGSLSVDNGETLQLTNGGAQTLTASGNTATHVVNGTVTGGTFLVTGNAASLTGGSGTGNASLIADLQVAPTTTGSFTSTGMKQFTALTINKTGLVSDITMNSSTATVGTFLNTAGTTTLNMNSTVSAVTGNFTVTAGTVTFTMNGAAAGTRTIAGNLAVNGGTLMLGSHIDVTGTATQAGAAVIALGDYNLSLANTYTHSGTSSITAGTGAFVAAATATRVYTLTTAVEIPNFTLNAPGFGIQLATNGLTVSKKFVHTAGDLDVNSLPFNVTGSAYTYTAGTYTNTGAAATGLVSLKGDSLTVTAAGNPVYPYLAVNSAGLVTFATSDNAGPTARTFGVTSAFTHTKGNIDLGINDLDIQGAAGTYGTATTAGSVMGSTGSNLGEVVFTGAASVLTLADNYSIQNVKVAGAASKSDSKVLTVTDNFTLGANFTFTSSARLVLNDDATITRSAGVFDQIPSFGTTVNVNYNPGGALGTDKELPVSSTVLNNLTVSNAAAVVTLAASATVNGTLYLTNGTISKGTKTLTIADGATINRDNGVFGTVATDVPTATNYNLTYSATVANTTTGREYVGGAVNVLTIAPTTTFNVKLNENFTVGSFVMNAKTNTPVLDLNTKTLTVNGMSQIQKGTVNNGSLIAKGDLDIAGGLLGATSNIKFAGEANQNFTIGAATTINDLTLDQVGTEPVPSVMLTGANLTLTGTLNFMNGLLNVEDQKYVMISNPVGAGQGFTRTITSGGMSHVIGTVRKNIKAGTPTPFGRNEFPVGTAEKYNPAAITIVDVTNPGPLGINVDVSYQGVQPTGIVGLPIVNGVEDGVDIARYPGFYWNIKSSSSFGNIHFDLELSNEGFNDFSNIKNVRIIRRQGAITDVNNEWSLQGANTQYDNFQSGAYANIVNVGSVGGIRTEGAIFTYGMKTRLSASGLENLTINQGTEHAVAIPLGDVFSGSQGALVYTASSTNEAVATVEVDGDTLWITGVGDGVAEISVRATDINLDFLTATFTVSTNPVGVEELEIPTEFALEQNYPNPFNPTTVIRFGLPEQSNVTLRVYNILGQEIATLLNTVKAAGWHEVNFNASQLGSGLYIYRIEAKDFVSIKKMMLVK